MNVVVGIGASAGGMEAIIDFFKGIPENNGFCFVLVQHLSPDHKSMMPELLSKHTKMEICQVEKETTVESDKIYLIPNDRYMTIHKGKLILENKQERKSPNKAIDVFFESLANDQQNQAVGIILSGSGQDGTKGAQAIKKQGGIIFAQDPATAKFESMPSSVIASGAADYVLAPSSMADDLLAIRDISLDGLVTDNLAPEDQKIFEDILNVVKTQVSCDFTGYKQPTIVRRLKRRMAFLKIRSLQKYFKFLLTDKQEAEALCKEFLIGVTRFFRDWEAFQNLQKIVIPRIVEAKSPKETIKVWVPGCSTGEEAYSLAILFSEYFSNKDKEYDIKIFASDIDKDAIEFASKGIYGKGSLVKIVSRERMEKFFLQEGDFYRVTPSIRKMIIFSHHNIIKDAPFSKIDLVSCRNMLIYFNSSLQQNAIQAFHFSLKVGGYLLLGPSENLGPFRDSFKEVNKKWRIYQNIKASRGYKVQNLELKTISKVRETLQSRAHRQNTFADILIKQLYSSNDAAAVFIDASYHIMETFGNYSRFLHLPEKRFELNILKMLPAKTAILLGNCLRKIAKTGEEIQLDKLSIPTNFNKKLFFQLQIQSIENEFGHNAFLLLFKVEKELDAIVEKAEEQTLDLEHYMAMEQELQELKEHLQKAIEESETSNEELQSSNEELISSNEELQSTNEELQSLNEELYTLNAEFQQKMQEVNELNDDLNNFFSGTEIGQIFLDRNLNIRKFTPAATRLINLIDSDIGRPLHHISTNMIFPSLQEDMETVLSTRETIEKKVRTQHNSWYLLKILPYIKEGKHLDGIALTFVDISDVVKLSESLEKEREFLNAVLESIQDGIMACNKKGEVTFINDSAVEFFGLGEVNEQKEINLSQLVKNCFFYNGEEMSEVDFPRVVANQRKNLNEVELEIKTIKGKSRTVALKAKQIISAEENAGGTVIALHDISLVKKSQQEISLKNEELRKLNEQLEERVAERTATIELQRKNLHDLFMKVPAMVCTLMGPEHIYELVNPRYQEMFGSRVLAGLPVRKALPELEGQGIFELLDEVFQKGEPYLGSEVRLMLGRDKQAPLEEIYCDFIYQPMRNEDNQVYGIVVFAYEVTVHVRARKNLQELNKELIALNERFKFVTNFMPQLVWSTMPNGHHDFFNQRWYDFTGLTYEQTKDKGWSMVLHPEDYDRAWQVWQYSLETGEPYEVEYRFKRHDGVYRWFLARALPMKDSEGSIIKWYGTCTDIHDQKKLNRKLAYTQQELALVNKSLQENNDTLTQINTDLDNFIYTASHDLKSPIANIEGLVSLLTHRLANKLTESDLQIMEMINKSIIRFKETIADLTNISRAQKNMDEGIELLSFQEIFQDVKSDIQSLIQEINPVIITNFEVENINYGRYYLRSIMYNLFSNALKYRHPERDCVVKISTRMDKGNLVLTVEDNGLGVPPEKKEKIFEMFRRMHSHVEGSGVGLYIIKRMIENKGGKISVTSEVGRGTLFEVSFNVEKLITVA